MSLTIGFPSPNSKDFPGEKRVFSTKFSSKLEKLLDAKVIRTEPGKNQKRLFQQSDMVVSLKYPAQRNLEYMRPGTTLISMIHFPTRPERVAFLQEKEINAISLDTITNKRGQRLVEDLKAVAWNGFNTAFSYIEKNQPQMLQKSAVHVVILGSGIVGQNAVDAAIHLGDKARERKYPVSVLVTVFGRNATENSKPQLLKSLSNADILVDASYRKRSHIPIIKNHELRHLPNESVIIDLSADPYTHNVTKAIEGIPAGTLKTYAFTPHTSQYRKYVPKKVPHTQQRVTFSCDGWPGIYPQKSMRVYEEQIGDLLEAFSAVKAQYNQLSSTANNAYIRALYRGSLAAYTKQKVPDFA